MKKNQSERSLYTKPQVEVVGVEAVALLDASVPGQYNKAEKGTDIVDDEDENSKFFLRRVKSFTTSIFTF